MRGRSVGRKGRGQGEKGASIFIIHPRTNTQHTHNINNTKGRTGEVDGVEEGPELHVLPRDLLELLQPHARVEGPRTLLQHGHGGQEGAVVGVWFDVGVV